MASWDLLELPVVDANQWEANREAAKEADAAFNAELLQRAEQWRQQQQEQQQAEGAASEANSQPRRVYEHDRSRDFAEDPIDGAPLNNGEQPPVDVTSSVTGPLGGRRSSQGGDENAAATEDKHSTAASTAAAAAASTGLVGIMFDTVTK